MRATQGFWNSFLSSLLLIVVGLALAEAMSDLTFTLLAGNLLAGFFGVFVAFPVRYPLSASSRLSQSLNAAGGNGGKKRQQSCFVRYRK